MEHIGLTSRTPPFFLVVAVIFTATAASSKTVRVKVKRANIRVDPATKARVLFKAEKGYKSKATQHWTK